MSVEAGEAAREMERVNRALDAARIHLAALDRAADLHELREKQTNSPLLTLIEHAGNSAARVTQFLREQSGT
ncbi:hypothetical protein [Micromonospora sp. WMMD980]|uniref:hypothetical protein n=1 Tax=Micromonospora sp. WMMD980 TaxID=3016088 RepID=UPI0024177C16|nr:hypothetical protein [Micromonospora sp. WMMD980]MDG4803693.1 hypothetical protein [Micromonospora sp. WMMD980]